MVPGAEATRRTERLRVYGVPRIGGVIRVAIDVGRVNLSEGGRPFRFEQQLGGGAEPVMRHQQRPAAHRDNVEHRPDAQVASI